jgi:hypothetical protein
VEKPPLDFVVAALLFGSGVICYVFVRRGLSASRAVVPAAQSQKRVFFFSPGIAVSLNRGITAIVVNLHILSTEPTELIFIRIVVMDSTGLCITCEHSEPIAIGKFDVTAKTIEQKITPQEMEKFQKGMMLNLNGYAKFRDGDKITTQQITLTTIPSI